MKTAILWFRRDLRIHDNAAIEWVCNNSEAVIPVYIHSPVEEEPWAPGAASRWWLHNSLGALQEKLSALGLTLHLFNGRSEEILSTIVEQTGAEHLVFNRLYEPHLSKRDMDLEKRLSDKIDITSFDSGLLFPPGIILNNQQLPYRVFTPFYKKIRPQLTPAYTEVSETEMNLQRLKGAIVSGGQPLPSLGLLDENNWHEKLHTHWKPGEDNAYELLDTFVDETIDGYEIKRNLPAIEATSRMSSYLHFGEITPQQIRMALWPLIENERGVNAGQSAEVFLKQLVWREFAHNILWHFPETSVSPMNKRYEKAFWRSSESGLEAWKTGNTGIPIIDAGMKQLWETGWMHNRVRMIVSSFLTKNLGISWLDGAKWFWDTLVDADLANNSMGWQWVAGCGVDAAPYYRIFNPNTQTKRFDKEFKYIDTWTPNHAELDYPLPMVDLSSSRDDAMVRYKKHIST